MVIFAVLYLQPQSHTYRVSINCAVFNINWKIKQIWLKMPIHWPKISVLGVFRPLNIIGHCRDPQKALPCVKPRQMSHHALKSVQYSFCCRRRQEKKEMKGKERYKSHNVVIFHVIVEKPPVNGF